MKYLLRDLIFQFIHKDNILKSRNQFNPLIYGVGERLIVSYAKKVRISFALKIAIG